MSSSPFQTNKQLKYIKHVEGPTLKSVMDKLRNNEENIIELDFNELAKKNCKLESTGGCLVARVLETNHTVKTLILKSHDIGDRGAIAIANMLKLNSTITYLDLYSNEITNIGIRSIAHSLYGHESLQHLSLWSNRIGDEGAIDLAEALKSNDSLTYLGLVHNQITKRGAEALLDAISKNHSLQTLNLASNHIPGDIASEISVALASNRMKAIQVTKEEQPDLGDKSSNQNDEPYDVHIQSNENYDSDGESSVSSGLASVHEDFDSEDWSEAYIKEVNSEWV